MHLCEVIKGEESVCVCVCVCVSGSILGFIYYYARGLFPHIVVDPIKKKKQELRDERFSEFAPSSIYSSSSSKSSSSSELTSSPKRLKTDQDTQYSCPTAQGDLHVPSVSTCTLSIYLYLSTCTLSIYYYIVSSLTLLVKLLTM